MDSKEAYALVQARCEGLAASKCVEYNSVFAFHMLPKDAKTTDSSDTYLDGMYSVDKKTGSVQAFSPLDLSPAEYRSGKEIAVPKEK